MNRQNVFAALRFFHLVLDRGIMSVFGLRFRQHYIRLSYKIKTRLFPEYGSYVPNLTAIGSPPQHSVWVPPSIPEWVLSEMRDLGREIDPILYPSDTFISQCQYYSFPVVAKPGHIYAELISQCTADHYTHCFAIPWLKHGGADLVSLKHIGFASKLCGSKVLVLLTEPGESPWLSRVPDNVDILNISKFVSEISHEELLVVISRLLVQLQIDILHIINSRHVWEVVCKYGLALKQRTRIYASIYCDDFDKFGQPVGFARQYLGSCYRYLTKVISDNSVFPNLLCSTYGYPKELFEVIKIPAPVAVINYSGSVKSVDRRVLWAGRLDRQKRPDILLAVAEALPDVKFTVFGPSSLDTSVKAAIGKLKKLDNVKMMGAYDGPETLPFSSHHVFLYTSQWDGMPNMVLEAAAAGIPIVASCVGGVGDVINGMTGFPVHEIEDISAYVKQVRFALDNFDEAKVRANAAKKYVEVEHTNLNFETKLLWSYHSRLPDESMMIDPRNDVSDCNKRIIAV